MPAEKRPKSLSLIEFLVRHAREINSLDDVDKLIAGSTVLRRDGQDRCL
jgi:hypothetical protein